MELSQLVIVARSDDSGVLWKYDPANIHAKHFCTISTNDDQFTQFTLLSCHWLQDPPSEAVRPVS